MAPRSKKKESRDGSQARVSPDQHLLAVAIENMYRLEGGGGRLLPLPPPSLVVASGLPDTPSSYERLNEIQWNLLAGMLGTRGDGYQNVLTLVERMQARYEVIEETRDELRRLAAEARSVARVLDEEMETFCAAATLSESLEGETLRGRSNGTLKWSWDLRPSSQFEPERFDLILHDALGEELSPVRPDALDLAFEAEWTWQRCQEKNDWGLLPLPPLAPESILLVWRLQLAEDVLGDFESHGVVPPYRLRPQVAEEPLSREQIDFVQRAHSLLLDVEAGEVVDADVQSRTHILQLLSDRHDVSKHDMQNLAVLVGAYRERKGRGRPARHQVESDLSHFWSVVRQLHRRHFKETG